MYSLNRVHLIGYQTQPVEVRTTPSGANVTDLNLVVPYTFTSAEGQPQVGKGFHTVTLWSKMAEIAGQYVRPSSQVFISGRLQTDSWEDEKSNEKRNKTKVIGMDMLMLDPKDGQLAQPAGIQHIGNCLNQVEVIGHATKEPEVRTTTSGQQVVSLGVATNERWRDKQTNEDRERTEFHNIVIWGDLGTEAAQHIKKGSRVYVSGRVQTRTWETQTGEKRATTEIVAEKALLLGMGSPAILDNISQGGAPVATPAQAPAPVAPPPEAPAADAAPTTADASTPEVPEVKYASEVKVEDLPF